MGRPATTTQPRRGSAPRFSRSELEMMEKLLREAKDNLLDGKIHQKLAAKFNRVPSRAGRNVVKVEHVRQWFAKKRKDNASAVASSPTDQNECVVVSDSGGLAVVPDASLSNNAPEISSDMPKGKKSPEVVKWEFEAKSSNGAWYDVATFVSSRIRSGKVTIHIEGDLSRRSDLVGANVRSCAIVPNLAVRRAATCEWRGPLHMNGTATFVTLFRCHNV